MANFNLRMRWGLGPRIDPHFDARVGRAVAELASGAKITAFGTGYIELLGKRPYDDLKVLLETIFYEAAYGATFSPWRRFKEMIHDRPTVWKQIRGLRYLTTDESTGLSLPLSDFNPNTNHPDWPNNAPAQLARALHRIDLIAGNKLNNACMIGLTADFEFAVIASRLKRIFWPEPLSWIPRMKEGEERAYIEHVLFGGLHPWLKMLRLPFPSVQRDAQDIALSGGFNPQLKRAMRDLKDVASATAPTPEDLDYGIAEAGRGVIVGVVDFGCDFAHPSFSNGSESRIFALWDQNAGPEPTLSGTPIVTPELPVVKIGTEDFHFGYGRVFKKAHIDAVLSDWLENCPADSDAPYGKLGYHPHDYHYTSRRPGIGDSDPTGAHGTCVLEVAAGRRRPSCRHSDTDVFDLPTVSGVASEADIVFVQIRTHGLSDGRKMLDANDVVDAVAYIFHLADEKRQPCVVNLSLNTMSGPHDGDGHFERRLSALLKSGPAGPQMKGRAVTVAAGNLPDHRDAPQVWQHIADEVTPGQQFEFRWRPPTRLPPAVPDQTRNSIEIWYEASDIWLQVSLVSPSGESFGPLNPGLAAELMIDESVCGSIVGSRYRPAIRDQATVEGGGGCAAPPLPGPSDDHARGRHVILLELDPVAANIGSWKVVLAAVDQSDASVPAGDARAVAFHAWLERDDEGQSGIWRASSLQTLPDEDLASTIGTYSCGDDAIVVGAYQTRWTPARLWGQSAHGPPRNADVGKPDISAPGSYLSLIRSTRGRLGQKCALQYGTSLSAPLVAGTIACLYEIDPQAQISTIKSALFATARKDLGTVDGSWNPQLGHGRLSPHRAVAWMRSGGQIEDA
ncbi:MAG TPA: S8 family serine peptidase [Phycisphaerae bacterium]|nr:S8 family serine peptidase [Phycisphaerae bacterium]